MATCLRLECTNVNEDIRVRIFGATRSDLLNECTGTHRVMHVVVQANARSLTPTEIVKRNAADGTTWMDNCTHSKEVCVITYLADCRWSKDTIIAP